METTKIDIVVKPTMIRKKLYEPFFAPYNYGDITFDAIDHLFLKLLEEEVSSMGTVVRCFQIDQINYPTLPTIYLSSEEKNTLSLSLSPRKIFWYFLQNKKSHAKRNFFILNVCSSEPFIPNKDLRIVDIRFLDNISGINKYFLYLYPYYQWEILGRNLKGETLNFVIPYP